MSHVTVLKKIKEIGELGLIDDHWDICDTAHNLGSVRIDSISANGEEFGSHRSPGQRDKDRPDDFDE